MTKYEFETSNDPLALIVSVNPSTGKCLLDTYHWESANNFLSDFKNDFPEMIHFITYNNAALIARKKRFGLNKPKVDT